MTICRYCQRPRVKKGMCNRHYLRWYRYGDVHYRKRRGNGEGSLSSQGYKLVTVNGRQVLEHRYLMELRLGRRLKPSEVVHHRDGDKLNNADENLELTTRRAHPHLYPSHAQTWQKLGNPARWKKGTTA